MALSQHALGARNDKHTQIFILRDRSPIAEWVGPGYAPSRPPRCFGKCPDPTAVRTRPVRFRTLPNRTRDIFCKPSGRAMTHFFSPLGLGARGNSVCLTQNLILTEPGSATRWLKCSYCTARMLFFFSPTISVRVNKAHLLG